MKSVTDRPKDAKESPDPKDDLKTMPMDQLEG